MSLSQSIDMNIDKATEKRLSTKLSKLLNDIVENHTNYDTRYILILRAIIIAKKLRYKCGFSRDSEKPYCPLAVIVLPNIGQVAWHMQPSGIPFENTNEKLIEGRVNKYAMSFS